MTEEEVVEEQAQEVATTEQKETDTQQSDKEYNFSQVRKQLKERDDYIKTMRQEMDSLKEEVLRQKAPKEEELDDDDFLTKKNAVRVAEQIADKKYAERMAEYEQQNFKRRARETYKDFDEIVTPQNLQRLEEEMPEIASLIAASTDNYKMACGAYKAIKTLQKENDPQKEIERNKEAIEKNKKTPMAAAAVDRRPIAQAARLTDKDYQELWQETQYYASKA